MRFLAAAILFLSFFFMLLQVNVSNVDLWWHLSTGKYIVENRALLQADPFSYTTQGRNSILLSGYWLAQVIFFEAYTCLGLKGIVLLRALAITSFLLLGYLTMKKRGIPSPVACVFLLVLFWFSLIIEGERPQVFTVLFFSLVYYLLDDLRTTGSKKAYFIPLLVMVLSNMHPGYIVCILLVTLYLVGEGLSLLAKRSGNRIVFMRLLAIWAATVLFSSFNPNGARVFVDMLASGFFTNAGLRSVEFVPTFTLYSDKIMPLDYPYLLLLCSSSVLVVRYARKMSFIDLILILSFSVLSFVAYRYLVFYMCVMTPITASLAGKLRDEPIFSCLAGRKWIREGFVAGFGLILAVLLLGFSLYSFRGFKSGENVLLHVPKGAADFLGGVKLKGNMFNDYNFGGYLIWRLYPEKKVFVDSRGLDYEVVEEYRKVAYAAVTSQWSWKDIIRKYDISYVIMQPLWPDGAVIPLVEMLLDKDDWTLIYADHLALIFVLNDGRNMEIIEKYRLDKRKGMDTIIAQAAAWAMGKTENAKYLITLGKAFFTLGRFKDAEIAFVLASQRDPNNPAIAQWLQKVRDSKNK